MARINLHITASANYVIDPKDYSDEYAEYLELTEEDETPAVPLEWALEKFQESLEDGSTFEEVFQDAAIDDVRVK